MDSQYYYEDEKICRNDCGKDYYKNDDKHICVKHCEDKEFIHPGNICSNEKCPSSAPFYYEKIYTIQIEGNSPSLANITNKQCVPNCNEYEQNYSYYEIGKKLEGTDENTQYIEDLNDKKCVEKCNNYEYNGRCYDICPEGLYISNKECVPKCQPNIFKDINGNLTCIQYCPLNEGDNEKYITSSGKCVKECPEEENYINGYNCSTNCGDNFFTKIENLNNRSYEIYKCIPSCSLGEVYIEGSKECLENCGDNLYLYKNDSVSICYRICSSTDKPFSTIDPDNNDKRVCDIHCNGDEINYGNDHICRANCSVFPGNKTIHEYTKECLSQCDLNSEYRYFQEKEIGNPYCQQNCDYNTDNNKFDRYIMPNYICVKNCPEQNNFVVRNGSENQLECLNKCPSNEQYAQYDPVKNEYFCTDYVCDINTDYRYYYLDKKICLNNCVDNDYRMENNTNICINSCQSINLYYDDDNKLCVSDCKTVGGKNYRKLNSHCDEKCDDDDFYNENDLICRIKCPKYQKIDGHICRESCSTSTKNKYEDENGICVEKCEDSNTGYIYYNLDFNNVCQNNCSNKYIKGNTCVNSCDESEINNPSSTLNTKFVDGKMCLSSCPITKRFIVYNEQEILNNPPLQYECLADCPINNTYYSFITNDLFTEGVFACKKECPAYINNLDSKINAKLCMDNGTCIGSNPYFIEDENNHNKECLSFCPDDKPYYKSEEINNIQCFSECPDNYVHMANSYDCIHFSKCESKLIKFSTKECVKGCGKNDKIYETEEVSYCLENCSISYNNIIPTGLLLTFDNKCVTECPTNSQLNSTNICDCSGLFYIDKETQNKKCISEDSCEILEKYPISVFGTNECIDYCDGILTQSGKECYRTEYNCIEEYEKIVILNNGDKICDCIEKYYYSYDGNGKQVKTCIKKGNNCDQNYPLLITETNECVQKCQGEYSLMFQNTICVSSCPALTKKYNDKNECICIDKWYMDKNTNKIICLPNNCPDEYPLYISDLKQCVSTCKGNDYNIYFNKECIKDCNKEGIVNRKVVSTSGDTISEKYAYEKCMCKNFWYYNETTEMEECAESDNKNCKDINSNYKYIIYSTKQCVSSCPDSFPFQFSNYCLKKCNEYTLQKIKPSSNSECKCEAYSEYQNNPDLGEVKCLTYEECMSNGYSIIEQSEQCYNMTDKKKCPDEYPIFFNRKCYQENKCPNGTEYDAFERKCKCKHKWYNDTQNSLIICLNQGINCPSSYNYIVFQTGECKTNNDINFYEFNYILYPS